MGSKGLGVTKLQTYDANSVPLWIQIQKYVRHAGSVLDIGAGIRPQTFVPCDRLTCLEPHGEYCEVLRDHGIEVIEAPAPGGLRVLQDRSFDAVVAFDVIEHMTREDGGEMIAEMLRIAREQVVIFTPLGLMPQSGGDETDPWGMQGQHWQQHRSGWTPADFPGWRCVVDEHFHARDGEHFGAFFALHG